MSKVYLAISTDEKEFNNIKELTNVFNDFDGLAVTFHGSIASDAYALLLERKKDGFVERIPYFGAHQHDLNHILFNPIIKIGDWLLKIDSSERLNPDFSSNIYPFLRNLMNNDVKTVYQRSKLLLFQRWPHQEFRSTPHFGLVGAQQKVIEIGQQKWFKDDREYFYSLRDEQRDKYSFVNHFMRYYLINDSNHNLLGLENFGDPSELFPKLELTRTNFLLYLRSLNVNNDVNSLKNYLINTNPLPDEMKLFINSILILNQFYRYNVLRDLTVSPDIRAPIVEIS